MVMLCSRDSLGMCVCPPLTPLVAAHFWNNLSPDRAFSVLDHNMRLDVLGLIAHYMHIFVALAALTPVTCVDGCERGHGKREKAPWA